MFNFQNIICFEVFIRCIFIGNNLQAAVYLMATGVANNKHFLILTIAPSLTCHTFLNKTTYANVHERVFSLLPLG